MCLQLVESAGPSSILVTTQKIGFLEFLTFQMILSKKNGLIKFSIFFKLGQLQTQTRCSVSDRSIADYRIYNGFHHTNLLRPPTRHNHHAQKLSVHWKRRLNFESYVAGKHIGEIFIKYQIFTVKQVFIRIFYYFISIYGVKEMHISSDSLIQSFQRNMIYSSKF